MLLIFLDTEFTSFDNPELISIGLASSDGDEFYAEVPYWHPSCSGFVHDVVVPLLSKTCQISFEDLRRDLSDWLNFIRLRDERVIVCFDSDYDKILFLRIFDNSPPNFVVFRGIGYRHLNGRMRAEYYRKNGVNEHHALNDAMALRHAFRGWIRAVR